MSSAGFSPDTKILVALVNPMNPPTERMDIAKTRGGVLRNI
ncbi:hypothetical protein EV06_1928 [Prochlorococcus sp. MIT 0602]|nr:hypothetical protein EV06_1928 [Prochlorococcus sp. MIT 0602]KGG15702.1 hypothetical protein EV07_1667 [Prochlorococcus sp. MIT 0603]